MIPLQWSQKTLGSIAGLLSKLPVLRWILIMMLLLIRGCSRILREIYLVLVAWFLLGEQGKSHELKSRIDLFSHPGCAIHQSDLGQYYPLKFNSCIYEMKATIPSIYLIEENPIKRGISQSGLFSSCEICVVVGLVSSAIWSQQEPMLLQTFRSTILSMLSVHPHAWCLWLQNGCCSSRHHAQVLLHYPSYIRETKALPYSSPASC